MAFGFTPSHRYSFLIENNNVHRFLTQAVEAAALLNWEISFISESGIITHSKFSLSSWSEQIIVTILGNEITIVSSCTGIQLFDWGKNKRNTEDFKERFKEVSTTISEDQLLEKMRALKTAFSQASSQSDPIHKNNERVTFLSVFIPREDYLVTPIILALTAFVFILMGITGVSIFTPDLQSLVDWGANFTPSTLQGECWRLLTACFIHFGIFHLLLNMIALVYVGLVLEPYLKASRFLAVYLATGIFASACSLWWHDYTVSAGASGAIFGLYGVFFALLTANVLHDSVKKSFLTFTTLFIIYNLLNGLKPDSGIDNAAHIAGLLSGLLIGYGMVPTLRKSDDSRLMISTISLALVLSLVGSFYLYKSIPNDYGIYDTEMARFSELEENSVRVFHLPESTTVDLVLKEIKDTGLPGWYENLRIISGLDKLNLPENIRDRNHRLKKYCELRIKHFELLSRAITEDTNIYEKEISESNEAIGSIVAELSE